MKPLRFCQVSLPLASLLAVLFLSFPALPQEEVQQEQHGRIEVGVRQFWGDVFGRPDLAFRPGFDTSKFNEYRAITNGLFMRSADIEVNHLLGSKNYLRLQASSTALRDQGYLVSLGHYGRYKFTFRWDQTPHIFTNVGRTLFTQSSPGVFTVPLELRTALKADPSLAGRLLATADPLDLSMHRKTATVGATVTPTDAWTFGFQFAREKSSGYRPIGSYSTGYELPEPLNYRTTAVRSSVEYARDNWGVQVGFTSSMFENKVGELVWDQAFNTTGLRGRIDLYPDNTAQNLDFAGAFSIGKFTRLVASISPGWMHQNDAFLPFSVNPIAGGDPVMPATSLQGSKQTLAMNYSLISRPVKHLELTARYRSYDYNNNTPALTFPAYVLLDGSRGDLFPGLSRRMPRQSLPFGFNRKNVELSALWEFHRKNTVKFGYELERFDRTHRDIGVSDEHTFLTSFDLNPNKMTLIRIGYRHADRNPDRYIDNIDSFPSGIEPAREQFALFRRFDEAARIRNRGDIMLQFSPLDTLNLSASFSTIQDDYHKTQYGTLKDISHGYTFDVDYTPRPFLSLYAEYAREKYRLRQRSRLIQGLPTPNNSPVNDWESSSRNLIDTYAAGADVSFAHRKVLLSGSYSLSAASGQILNRALGDPTAPGYLFTGVCTFGIDCRVESYPDTKNRLHNVAATLQYGINKNFFPRIDWRYERYTRVDWQTQIMSPYMFQFDSTSNLQLFLGADQPSYKGHVVSATVEYRF